MDDQLLKPIIGSTQSLLVRAPVFNRESNESTLSNALKTDLPNSFFPNPQVTEVPSD